MVVAADVEADMVATFLPCDASGVVADIPFHGVVVADGTPEFTGRPAARDHRVGFEKFLRGGRIHLARYHRSDIAFERNSIDSFAVADFHIPFDQDFKRTLPMKSFSNQQIFHNPSIAGRGSYAGVAIGDETDADKWLLIVKSRIAHIRAALMKSFICCGIRSAKATSAYMRL